MAATRKILVVDDEPEIRDELTEYLVDKGYKVTEAGDGLEAIEKFQADNFIAVITDMDMPRCPGNNLIERLRQIDANVPIIVLTGRASEDIPSQAGDAGATTTLIKPIRIRRLDGVLKASLEEGGESAGAPEPRLTAARPKVRHPA